VVAFVEAIAAAYPADPVPWMVLSYNPLTGMLSVVPAPEPSWIEGGERVELTLSSLFLEMQAERTYDQSSDGSYDPLYERVWAIVEAEDGGIFRSGHPDDLTRDPDVRRSYLGEQFRLD